MSKGIVKIYYTPVVAKLVTKDNDARYIASEALSYKVSGSEFSSMSSWDGYSSLFKMKNNQFPSGLVRFTKKRLERAGYTVITKCLTEIPSPAHIVGVPIVDSFPEDPRYDYQEEVMNRFIKIKGMIAQVATGGGKSRIFKLCERKLQLPTLFLSTRKSLMYQMAEAYEKDVGLPVGLIGDGHWSPILDGANFAIVDTLSERVSKFSEEAEVVRRMEALGKRTDQKIKEKLISLDLPTDIPATQLRHVPPEVLKKIQSVRARIKKEMFVSDDEIIEEAQKKGKRHAAKRKQALELLKNIGFLCLEEAHEVSGGGFYNVANACKNANYRLALTATPFMKDDEEANMRLMAASGPIGIKVTEKLLIDRGILATPYFKYITPARPDKLFRSTAWQSAYRIGIVENENRNKSICNEVARAKQYGLTSMVLVGHQKHGKMLESSLKNAGIKVKFIYGTHEQKERKAALIALGSGKIDCLIGSTILDVGVDVPSVGLVVLAGGGKAEVSLRQRVGRGLRAKKTGPNVCLIVDFKDYENTFLRRHSLERERIVNETPGFAENVVDDFNFEDLGFKKSPINR